MIKLFTDKIKKLTNILNNQLLLAAHRGGSANSNFAITEVDNIGPTNQWHSKEDNWGHALWNASLGGASTNFL